MYLVRKLLTDKMTEGNLQHRYLAQSFCSILLLSRPNLLYFIILCEYQSTATTPHSYHYLNYGHTRTFYQI